MTTQRARGYVFARHAQTSNNNGHAGSEITLGALMGFVDSLKQPNQVYGWAYLPDAPPGTPKPTVTLVLHGKPIGRGVADIPRGDLSRLDDGAVSFAFEVTQRIYAQDFIAGHAVAVVSITAEAGSETVGTLPIGAWFAERAAEAKLTDGLRQIAAALRDAPFQTAMPDRMGTWLQQAAEPVSEAARNAFNRAPDWNARAILLNFESLGDNCEFGLVQRHFGIETAGLLRWGAAEGGVNGLVPNLARRFEGAGGDVTVHDVHGEYMSFDERCRLWFHTDRGVGTVNPEVLIRNERARISFLARSLMEAMDEGEKVFVFKSHHGSTLADATALSDAIAQWGNATLLWVTLAQREAELGVVEEVRPRLLHGYLDRFSPGENIHAYCSYGGWLRLCREALYLRDRPA